MLLDMAEDGAWQAKGRDRHFPQSDGLAYLEGLGFIKETNSSFYTLTEKAMSTALLLPVGLKAKGQLSSFRRQDIPPERMSALELMGLLSSENWAEETEIRKLKPHTKRSKKKAFYVGGNKAPSKLYMRALLESKRLFEGKLDAIHHQQLEAYLVLHIACLFIVTCCLLAGVQSHHMGESVARNS